MTTLSGWDQPDDYIDDPEGDRPLLVESVIANERRDGRSLRAQQAIDKILRGKS